MRRILLSIFILFSFINCKQEPSSNESGTVGTRSILYVGTDTSFTSSILYSLDLQNGANEIVLGDQSNDFVLLQDGERVVAVNRDVGQLNYRELRFASDTELVLGEQIKFPNEPKSGPQNMFFVENDIAVFLQFGVSRLDVIEVSTGTLLQSLGAGLDTPDQIPFRPVGFLRVDEDTYYVSHQGMKPDNSYTKGAMFKFVWNGEMLIAEDLDQSKEGIQGVTLNAHTPVGFHYQDNVITVIGMCWDGAPGCVQGIDEIDLRDYSVSAKDNTVFKDLVSLGTGFFFESEESIFAMVAGKQGVKFSRFSLTDQTSEELGDFGGINLAMLIPSDEFYYVGFPKDQGSGIIRTYDKEGLKDEFSVKHIPIGGVLIKDGRFDF